MFKLGLEKAEKPEIKLPIFAYMKKAREFKKEKKSISVSLAMLKSLTV